MKRKYNPAQRQEKYRKKIKENSCFGQCNQQDSIVNYDLTVEAKQSVAEAKRIDQGMRVEGTTDTFASRVCIICDRFIIGTEKTCKIQKNQILSHMDTLGVVAYETYYGSKLHPQLVTQYEVDGLEGMLLSPRSRENDGLFDACSTCINGLKRTAKNGRRPPKHAIANGFAIGHIPKTIITEGLSGTSEKTDIHEEQLTDIVCSFLSPVRAFGYVFAYTAGAHKSIRGHYSFYEVDQTHVGSVMNYFQNTGANPHIYCVLCGRMTPKQKEIVKQKVSLDTQLLIKLLTWFSTQSGHPGYKNIVPPSKCPVPTVIEDPASSHNTDEEHNPEIEHKFDGATFHFSSAHEPEKDTGVYGSSQNFILAMMTKTMPTLLVQGGNYANLHELLLENVCALQFPFGNGGPKMKRRNPVSAMECYRHYLRLSLCQFMRGDFLLLINHMYNRCLSYKTAMIKCRSNFFGSTLGEKVSTLKIEDLNQAVMLSNSGQGTSGIAGQFLTAVKTSCTPIGHSAEAAKFHRRQHFAMDDYFGGSALFLTITPCDACTFRVRLFAQAGRSHTLPSLADPFQEKSILKCALDLNFRQRQRMAYPGACSLVYQHLMQIVIEKLLCWDPKTQRGRRGIFGIVEGFARTDEEQGRKTLHGHWQIFIKGFNECRDALYNDDMSIREQARHDLLQYVDEVISADYGDEFVVTHNCSQSPLDLNPKKASDIYEECEPELLRKARHKDHCLDVMGKVLKCKKCKEAVSSSDLLNMALYNWQNIHDESDQLQQVSRAPTHLRADLLDIAAYRYPYDFGDNGHVSHLQSSDIPTWLTNKTVRAALVRKRFDEHACMHRSACFKNGPECRAMLPMLEVSRTFIHDNTTEKTFATKKTKKEDDDNNEDDQIRTVKWHYIDGSVREKSQYMIIPKRRIGSQFLNQHSVPISEVIACNTNIAIGDPSFTYYTTLYKSKDTQQEDRDVFQRVTGSVGRRIWRQLQIQSEQKQVIGNDNNESSQDNEINDSTHPDHIEGLGRVLTGINAALSRNVVSSTMAHLLVCQEGSRFTYSHKFSNLLLTQMEDSLEGREVHFVLRRNKSKSGEVVQWADSSADDYLFRPKCLDTMCLYQMVMSYEKKFKTFKEMGNDDKEEVGQQEEDHNTKKKLPFLNDHPGHRYAYLQKLKHHVIPKISMTNGKICNIELLQIGNRRPTEDTRQLRENYAKYALMLFKPFRTLTDLQYEGSYWQQFLMSQDLWNHGKRVLQNIQTRMTVEKHMKRPPDPLVLSTNRPESTYRRSNKEDEEQFDIDINTLDIAGDNVNHCNEEFQPYQQRQLRSHVPLIQRANVENSSLLEPVLTAQSLIYDEDSDDENVKNDHSACGMTTCQDKPQSSAPQNYYTILTFIEGALVGLNDSEGQLSFQDNDEGQHPATESINDEGKGMQNRQQIIPTLKSVAMSAGKQLDEKQYVAYEVICCTFLLQLVYEGGNCHTNLGRCLNVTLDSEMRTLMEDTTRKLKARGAKEQLIMLLTGPAGCGKSTSVQLAQQYCHSFCMAVAVAFDDITFYFTSTTGSSAALFGGMTIHSAAHMNKTNISDALRSEWDNVRILIIDEISFFTVTDMQKLDKQLKRLTGRTDCPYGGMSIVFSGDFHQLQPICSSDNILYSSSPGAMTWENTINCAIFLDNCHRFKNDPTYGDILARMRMGKDTKDDRRIINRRVIKERRGEIEIPKNDEEICFACPTNKERNAITAGIFKEHILATHPTINDIQMPPDHTLMVEASMRQKRKKVSQGIHDTIVTKLGDDDIKSTDFSSKGSKIDPLLRLYTGSPHMCITNDDIKQGRGNGTMCRCVKVKLKTGAKRQWKNWDGRKVWTVSAEDVEWVQFEHWPNEAPKNVSRQFKLKPQTFSTTVQFPLGSDCGDLKLRVGNIRVTQIPVNSNIATTGHKLQGMSKKILVVNSWNYTFPNWIYVVLSRVKTLSGLFLLKPLDLMREFKVPQTLMQFEQRMMTRERHFLNELNNVEEREHNEC